MATRIIYKLENNAVAIITPVGDMPIDMIAKRDVPAGVAYKIVDSSIIPQDRIFRDAWCVNFDEPDGYGIGKDVEPEIIQDNVTASIDAVVEVNMSKAIEIKKNIIRRERLALFADLDVQFMRALELGDIDKQREIAEKKRLLRDATIHPSIVEALTPEELIQANPLAEINS